MTSPGPSLQDRAKRTRRLARRTAAGARGLGATTVVRWAVDRRFHPYAPLKENSSFTWVVARSEVTTAVWLHNYWSDAYGIPEPQFQATLLDLKGRAVDEWTISLRPDATEVIDIRERCLKARASLPFEGSLLLRLAHEKVVPGRPVQVFAEYSSDNGETTGVHGQYGLLRHPLAHMIGTMRLEAGEGRRTSVVLTNPYVGAGGPLPARPLLTVVSAMGQRRSVRLAAVAPLASRRLYIDEAVTDVDVFLGGKPGHARVTVPFPASRMATTIEYPDGRTIVNHGSDSRLLDQGIGTPASWTASASVASALVLCDERRDTVITLVNDWGPIAFDYEAEVTVQGPDGRRLGVCSVLVERDGMTSLSVRDHLREWGVPLPAVAHAEVRLRPIGRRAQDIERPAIFDVLVGIVDDGLLCGEVQVGGEFFNGPIPPGVRAFDIRRTRTFGRVSVGAGIRNRIFLAHPVADNGHYDTVAKPSLSLLDSSGAVRAKRDIEIQARGCCAWDVEELFEGVGDLLADGKGVVRVRDTTARLYGYYMAERTGARTFPICHLIGG